MGKIAKNYVYNVAYQLLVLIAPIVTAPYLARVLGADHLGIYSYINSSGNIITTLSLLGIYAYGNRQTAYVRENRRELTSVFWELETARLLLGIAGTVVYILYAVLNSKYCSYFLIYYPYILAQFIDCSWIYVGLEDMKPAVLKNFAAKLLNIIGIFLLVKTREDLWIYILLLALTAFLANLSIYTQLPKYVGKPKVDLRRIPRHLKGSVFLFLPQVAALLYLQVDKVMLEWMTGTTREISFYDQAEKIVTIPLSLLTVLSTVMMPRIANEYKKKNQKEIQRLLFWAGRAVLCLAMPMMLGMFCIAKQFIPCVLGKRIFAHGNGYPGADADHPAEFSGRNFRKPIFYGDGSGLRFVESLCDSGTFKHWRECFADTDLGKYRSSSGNGIVQSVLCVDPIPLSAKADRSENALEICNSVFGESRFDGGDLVDPGAWDAGNSENYCDTNHSGSRYLHYISCIYKRRYHQRNMGDVPT